MSVPMRAKMIVSGITEHKQNSQDPESKTVSETLYFRAVCKSDGYPADGKDENNSFATWTPSANLTMCVNNPDLVGKLKVGDTFYLDFSPVMVVQRAPQ